MATFRFRENDAADLDVVVQDVALDDVLVGCGKGVWRSVSQEDDVSAGVIVSNDLVNNLLE
jgi:hypothetical protein